ncbi:ABC transporter permease [Egicoccus sp. AB-alg6-2]|uniref:ABC transporter permease n=1 Tax=Egicoccus sp. AB-alg6-2 TaxID=3242692 RepID=UPI00359EC483
MTDRHEDGPAGEPAEHGAVTLSEEEVARQEIEAAKEREAATPHLDPGAGFGQRLVAALTGTSVLVTILSFVAAIVIGGVIIALTEPSVRETFGYFFARPGDAFRASWEVVSAAYLALFRGSLGGRAQISETLVSATPLILTGLAVAVPLRAGLFNIGAEGQLIAGGMVAGLVGFSVTGLPLVLHLPLAAAAGIAGGWLYGWLPGALKARTGAHEVISTIMLNNIARLVSAWMISTALFRRPDRADPISKTVETSAQFPRFLDGLRVNTSLLMALALAVFVFWLVERSTRGFELNAVGLNAEAARTAGMNPDRTVISAMATGGALAGAAGAALILGLQHRLTIGFSAGLGFDGITVALLGRGRIGGTVAAGLLFGALRAGGRSMQAQTGTSLDLVLVIQALIIVFIAAPGLVRAIFRVKADDLATGQVAKGWGS